MHLYRADGLLDLAQAKRRKVVFVGLGSLGSHVLSNLAYPWGEIVLIDDETLGRENVERHILGQSWVRTSKVDGMATWLTDRGVELKQITVHASRVQDVLHLHTDADLVIVTTGTASPACEYVNRTMKCPILYSIVYPLGSGGEVTVIKDPADICYICAEQMLGRWNIFKPDPNYGVPEQTSQGPLNAVPMLRWPVNLTAAQCARMALEILQGKEVVPQVLIQANSWQMILSTQSRSRAYKALAGFVFKQKILGLRRHWALDRRGECFELKVRNTQVSLPLSRWSRCPLHSTRTYSAEEI